MSQLNLTQPLTFEPIFMERVWGGRRLKSLYRKRLPTGARIGESWEIVDRPEAQSVVHEGPLRGTTLHELWMKRREQIFGTVPDAPRFPLLLKLLDAHDKLSLQVHPPAEVARALRSEEKNEFWYVAEATPAAHLFVGLRRGATKGKFQQAVKAGTAQELVHHFPVKTGDAMFLPSGRLHAVGAGNLLVEVQQNSDTTYRVFDWNRKAAAGKSRKLHIEESLRSINFSDFEPALTKPTGETLVKHHLFQVDKWNLSRRREAMPAGRFAVFVCLEGEVECAAVRFKPGDFFLLPASLPERSVAPRSKTATVLRTTIP